jgi:hypothetical protein
MFETTEATVADWNDFWYNEDITPEPIMTQSITIENLLYEELVLLQEIMIKAEGADFIDLGDLRTFNSLYEKVMNS